ncbi:hypothetical protein LXL04_029407 [Taraxacum kok-saghyz]
MKLSLSLASSKNPSKPSKSTSCSSMDQDNQSPKKEFVTEFDSSLTLADSNSKRTIQTKNIDLPIKSDDPNLKFEVDPNSTDEPINSHISYGLNVRTKKDCPSDRDPEVGRSESLSSINHLMLMKMRSDLKILPEDKGMAEFEDVSVEELMPALSKGYGWYE